MACTWGGWRPPGFVKSPTTSRTPRIGFARYPLTYRLKLSKSAENGFGAGSRTVLGDGLTRRLPQFRWLLSRWISEHVCDGTHRWFVMKKSGVGSENPPARKLGQSTLTRGGAHKPTHSQGTRMCGAPGVSVTGITDDLWRKKVKGPAQAELGRATRLLVKHQRLIIFLFSTF